jgi:hypothetical protein
LKVQKWQQEFSLEIFLTFILKSKKKNLIPFLFKSKKNSRKKIRVSIFELSKKI